MKKPAKSSMSCRICQHSTHSGSDLVCRALGIKLAHATSSLAENEQADARLKQTAEDCPHYVPESLESKEPA